LKEELLNWLNFAFMPGNPEGGANPLSMLIPIIGMLAIFYLLLIRPQQKRQKETQRMIEAVRKGDRVVTASGLYGTIAGMKENIVVLKIAENVKVEMLKSSITGVVEKGE
jgi:preprotein translocase subunit YajC